MDNSKIFVVIALVSILVFSSFFLFLNVQSLLNEEPVVQDEEPVKEVSVETDLSNSMGLYLHLVHKRDGEVVGDLWKENDLILSNWVNWTGMTLTGLEDFWGIKDDQGQVVNLTRVEDPTPNVYIAIGTDNTAPTFSDYQLGTETHREQVDDWLIETSGTSYNLTATAFFTFDSGYNIVEAGWCSYMSDVSDEVFWTRDTFSSQDMVENDTLSVSVIMEFTGGITSNYGKLVSNVIYSDDRQYEPVSYGGYSGQWGSTPQNGASGNVDKIWFDTDRSNTYGDYQNWEMIIGTSNTAFALSDYELGNEVYDDTIDDSKQVIYDESGADANITVIGYFSIDSSYTIYEVGVLSPLEEENIPYHHISWQIMVCREVVAAGWSVESGDNIAVYLKWIIDQP
jgi:hypothetical protein